MEPHYPLLPIAHVNKEVSQRVHPLEEHLSAVAELASKMAGEFGAAEWGKLAGQWHDLGKFSLAFQQYIRRVSGYESSLVDATTGRVNHSSAGALLASKEFGLSGRPLCYLIAGHHAGLPDWFADEGGGAALENRLQSGESEGLLGLAVEGILGEHLLKSQLPAFYPNKVGGTPGLHLWIRMLFSCLTDADFLDTELFMDEGKSAQRGDYPPVAKLLTTFNEAMSRITKAAQPSLINDLRADVLRQCREKAALPPGLFTLTVPTGGGKTLSSLAFALEHAVRNGKRRIVYAIPYTSIIEQTADVFRGMFKDAVLEHHSNLDGNSNSLKSRLAAENWDAPLVVTTNVQLFESLFAARTSRCRKLHNLVNSVILLDEAQLLPPDFLQPILDVMRLLMAHYGVTFVLCTATQPALASRQGSHGRLLLRGLDNATEITCGTDELYRQLERVSVTLPRNLSKPSDWDEIAEKIARHPSVLAIVNRRADCRELHRRMPPGTIHLSALMCGEHRSNVIEKIKRKLLAKESVRVISTQLIEAGVDIDFPVVYRALAGLDSVAQAAGRCNRENNLPDKGKVIVFVAPKPAPAGLLRFGEDACRRILSGQPENLLTPQHFKEYFNLYYGSCRDVLDKHGIQPLLEKDARECKIQFRSAADRFHLIDEDDSISVIVPYTNEKPGEALRDSHPLIARLRCNELHRDLLRQLQRFTVNLRQHDFNNLLRSGDLEEVVPGLWVLKNETAYHPYLGLLLEEASNPDPGNLCC